MTTTLRHTRHLSYILTLGLLTTLAMANEAEMQNIITSWKLRQQDVQNSLRQATSAEERRDILAAAPQPSSIANALWKSISKRTGTRLIPAAKGSKRPDRRVPTYEYEEVWAAPAVIWWLQHADLLTKVVKANAVDATLRSLLGSVERLHYAHPDMAELCPTLAASPSARSYDLLEKILTSNTNPRARSHAALGMSLLLKDENVYSIEGSPKDALSKRIAYIRYALEQAPAGDYFGTQRLEDIAMEELYHINKLSVGSIPPQVALTDSKGQAQLLPTVGEAQLFYFWSPLDPASIALLRTATSLKKQFPTIHFKAITTGISTQEINENPELSIPEVQHYIDPQGKAIQDYRVPKAGYAVLISPRARILYIGEPNMKLQAAINSYDTESQKEQEATRPSAQPPSAVPPSSGEIPPLRELPPLGF